MYEYATTPPHFPSHIVQCPSLLQAPYKSLPQQNVQTHNHDGMAPIHLAADNAHHDVLRELVRTARADINQRVGVL